MEIKIKAAGKNVILDNEIVCKVVEGADLNYYKTMYNDNHNSLVSVDGDPASEVRYHFSENLAETDSEAFSMFTEFITEIRLPGFVEIVHDNLMSLANRSSYKLRTVKCGLCVNTINNIFGPDMDLPFEINLLLPGGSIESGVADVDLSNLPAYHEKLIIWIPSYSISTYKAAYPNLRFADISEYKEQA